MRLITPFPMNAKSMLSLVVALMAAAFVLSAGAAVTIGSPAPEFTLSDITGKTHSLSEFRGKTVVLEWHNPECPIVRKHYESGNIPATQRAAESDGVVWLTINSGAHGRQGGDYSGEQLQNYLKRLNAAPTAYLRDPDGKVGRLYGAKTTPHIFIIGADGILRYNGAIDSIRSSDPSDIKRATNYVAAALEDIKTGRAMRTATSQPYGCAVKY